MTPEEMNAAFLSWIRERQRNGIHWMMSYKTLGIDTDSLGHVCLFYSTIEQSTEFTAKEYWVPHTDEIMLARNPSPAPILKWNGCPVIHCRSRMNGHLVYPLVKNYKILIAKTLVDTSLLLMG